MLSPDLVNKIVTFTYSRHTNCPVRVVQVVRFAENDDIIGYDFIRSEVRRFKQARMSKVRVHNVRYQSETA